MWLGLSEPHISSALIQQVNGPDSRIKPRQEVRLHVPEDVQAFNVDMARKALVLVSISFPQIMLCSSESPCVVWKGKTMSSNICCSATPPHPNHEIIKTKNKSTECEHKFTLILPCQKPPHPPPQLRFFSLWAATADFPQRTSTRDTRDPRDPLRQQGAPHPADPTPRSAGTCSCLSGHSGSSG